MPPKRTKIVTLTPAQTAHARKHAAMEAALQSIQYLVSDEGLAALVGEAPDPHYVKAYALGKVRAVVQAALEGCQSGAPLKTQNGGGQ